MRASSIPSRRRARWTTRTFASAWLVLYALIAAVLPLADARAEHGANVVVHIEDGNGSDCPAQHDASVCHTCQVLTSSVGTVAAGAGCPVAVSRRELPAVEFATASGRVGQRGHPASRAPPRS